MNLTRRGGAKAFFIVMGVCLTVLAVVLMLVVWLLAWRVNNLGVVDVAWSLGFLPVATGFALLAPGDPERRALVALMAGLWSVRLCATPSCGPNGGRGSDQRLFGSSNCKPPCWLDWRRFFSCRA